MKAKELFFTAVLGLFLVYPSVNWASSQGQKKDAPPSEQTRPGTPQTQQAACDAEEEERTSCINDFIEQRSFYKGLCRLSCSSESDGIMRQYVNWQEPQLHTQIRFSCDPLLGTALRYCYGR